MPFLFFRPVGKRRVDGGKVRFEALFVILGTGEVQRVRGGAIGQGGTPPARSADGATVRAERRK